MKIECQLVNKISKKSGNEYTCLEIKLGNYTKTVFLEPAELELIKIYFNSNK